MFVCFIGRGYVCCGECYVVSNECDEPTSCLVQPIVAHCCEVMYFGCFSFRGELGFLNCDAICMCVVNKQFELFEFVFDYVHVDLQYDDISLTFTAGLCVCLTDSTPKKPWSDLTLAWMYELTPICQMKDLLLGGSSTFIRQSLEPQHLGCTQCSILFHLIDIYFLTCICLWHISQIQTCVW